VERSRRNKVLDDGWKVVETITNEDLKPVV